MNTIQETTGKRLSQQEVQEILEPYKDDLYGCVADGWDAWVRFGRERGDLRLPLKKRARAAFVFDHIVASAIERFTKYPGVRWLETKGLFRLLFPGGVVVRFKKFDQYRRPRKSRTKQYYDYVFQLSLNLDGVTLSPVNLFAGYRLTEEEVELKDISITCPAGNRNDWYLEIPPTGLPEIQDITKPTEGLPAIRAKVASRKKSQKE